MKRVIVVGAGIVGASVAAALSLKGVTVTVLEAQRPAAGTSRASFAWPNANDKLPREYFDLNFAGLVEHHRLATSELADPACSDASSPPSIENEGSSLRGEPEGRSGRGASWFYPTGNLEIVTGPERKAYQHAKVARLREWGYQARLISEADAQRLEPDLLLPPTASYAFYADEGWVAAPVLVHRLLDAAQEKGAEIRFPIRVDALAVHNDRVVGVIAGDQRLSADLVIDCTGPAAATLLEALGMTLARQRSPGLLVVTEPMPTCLNRVVHAPGVHLRPDGAGRVLIGSEDVDATLPSEGDITSAVDADSSWSRDLLRRAQTVLPVLADARIEGVRLGWRPKPADGLSAVGPVPGLAGYYLVFTHSGVTLGPILGKLVADEVLSEKPAPELALFRPDRLFQQH